MPTSSSTPNSRAKAKLVVVDDDGVLRAHFIGALRLETDLDIIGECGSVASALALIPLKPDLVLLDLGLPDGNGIAVIDALRAHAPECKVLVVTVFEDRASVLATLRAGADGYILKDTGAEALATAVHATLAGETPISARAAGHLLSLVRDDTGKKEVDPARPTLSARERELLELLARGMSRKEAARKMELSPFTVAEYLQNIYRKLSVRSRGEAVYEALQARLIDIREP